MRRPRKKLEVSTFPFLAVLLCAMGSLMLLLFIMDRRAKAAAKFRVSEELQTRQQRSKEEEDARNKEWEKARAQLHLSLQQQHDSLVAESKGVQHKLTETTSKIAVIEARHLAVDSKIKSENDRIGALHLDLERQRSGLQQDQKMEAASKAELIAAASELAELERAFLALRALRERDKHTYSVVPYRGKRGELRPPIYVECVQDGVVFHPDKKSLQAWSFSPTAVRDEIEKRAGPKSANKDETRFVLFLIRPSGITSYYKALSALKDQPIEFGYELIDEGWALDFSGASHAKDDGPSRPPVPWDKQGDPNKPSVGKGPALTPGGGGSPTLLPPNGFGSSGASKPAFPVGPSGVGGESPRPPSFVPIAKSPMGGGADVRPIPAPIPGSGVGVKKSPNSPPNTAADGDTVPGGIGAGVRKSAAPPLSKLLGNKDFVITVECRANAVTIDPSGLIYRWTGANTKDTDAALAQTIANLIARRQASVRDGEPPYRPQLRFRVRPDGLRTYLHVYPLLEPLRLPMTRENVEE